MAAGPEEAKLELYLQWLEVNGAELRCCNIGYCNSSVGFGIFSSNDVHDGILAVVPLHLAITPMRVLEDPLIGPECRLMFEEGDVDDRLLIMLFLTVERLRKNSSWKPYLDMLPTEFGNPLWFEDYELSELKGTTLYRATELQKKNLKSLFHDKVKKFVEKLLVLDGETGSREVKFEDFLWANSIFWSRALNIPFPSTNVFPRVQQVHDNSINELVSSSTTQVLAEMVSDGDIGNSESDVLERETIWVEGLVPGIDFCNHALKPRATWEVDGSGSITGIPSSMYLLSAGDILHHDEKEITISYGNKGNEELLYLYGFVMEDNPDDYLMIHYPLEAVSDMPYSEAKIQLLEAQRAQLRCLLPRSLLKNVFFPENGTTNNGKDNQTGSSYRDKCIFPEEFLSALRTITMKDNELYQVTSLLEELVEPGMESQPSESEVQSAIKETCRDSNALQLLVDLLNMKISELEEGSGSEESDASLLNKTESRGYADEEKRFLAKGSQEGPFMSRNRWASIVYRYGQKQLARRFLREAEQALELALCEEK